MNEEYPSVPTPSFLDEPRTGDMGTDIWGFVKFRRERDGEYFAYPILVPCGTAFDPNHKGVKFAVEKCSEFMTCKCTLQKSCKKHSGKGVSTATF